MRNYKDYIIYICRLFLCTLVLFIISNLYLTSNKRTLIVRLFAFYINFNNFGIIEQSQRKSTIANSSAYYHRCIPHFVHTLIIFGIKSLVGSKNSTNKRQSELSAVGLVGCSPWGHKRAGHDLVTKQQHDTTIHLLGCPT